MKTLIDEPDPGRARGHMASMGDSSEIDVARSLAQARLMLLNDRYDRLALKRGSGAARALLGAATNRLEGTISNLSVSSENLTAAESRLRDVDIAKETTKFTKEQVLLQAGTSVLAQANFLPQNFLSLLG